MGAALTQRMVAWTQVPSDPVLVEEHRRTVLLRTRVAAGIACVVMPVTVLGYLLSNHWHLLRAGLAISAAADAGALACLLLARRPADRHYHLPFFLLVGLVCPLTEVLVLQLTGGGAASDFFFPYFLIFFGVATLFPSRFGWALGALLMSPLTYVAAELLAQGSLRGRALTQLFLLLDYAFIAAIASRVTTRIFFNEASSRLALERANRQLLALDEAKRAFFADISHDLRSPLTVIAGPLNALSSDSARLEPRHRRYVEFALRGTARLDAMINDLLELARIEAGAARLNRSRLNLDDLLEGLLESLVPYAATLDITLDYRGPGRPVYAEVDGDKLERVVMNLLSNALKFSPAGTTVTVGLSAGREGLAVSVADQGMGISREDQERIFRRFARSSDPAHRRVRGTGLGLSVVREFVELHGGAVEVQSEPGRGSTFTIRLPPACLVETPPERPAPSRPRSRAPHLLMPGGPAPGAEASAAETRPRLLLVEDSEEAQRFLAEELGPHFQVEVAPDGRQALRAALARPPDVILLDLMMPGMEGDEVCRLLRRDRTTAEVPVLMSSSRGDLPTRLRCFEAGADDFLAKPFDPRELLARLRALLRRCPHRPRARAATHDPALGAGMAP